MRRLSRMATVACIALTRAVVSATLAYAVIARRPCVRRRPTIDRPRPVRVLSGASEVATGAAHTCAVGDDRTVRCWGANESGQLGDGTFVGRRTPTLVIR